MSGWNSSRFSTRVWPTIPTSRPSVLTTKIQYWHRLEQVFFGDSKPVAQIDASVRGGGQNVSYLLSFDHYKTSGIIDDSNMRREALRLNIEAKVNSWLKIGSNTNLAFTKYRESLWQTTPNNSNNKTFAARTNLPIQPTHEVIGMNPSDLPIVLSKAMVTSLIITA